MIAEARELTNMLTYARPHLSDAEEEFIQRFLEPLPGWHTDEFGNGYVKVGESKILWSSHTDTVHTRDGRQKIHVSAGGWVTVHKKSKSSCLGGDNTVGVWLMREMILAGVPGLYVFHRGEEKGRLGSEWIARNNKSVLEGIDFAIAFDRRKEISVITHQMMGRCCSDDFADQMIEKLGLGHKRDDGGSYTDTASYMDIVSECTNISAGFYHEHSSSETVNLNYAVRLRDALLAADWSELTASRDPTVSEYRGYGGAYGRAYGFLGNWNDDWSGYPPRLTYSNGNTAPTGTSSIASSFHSTSESDDEFTELADLVFHHSETVAAYLMDSGISIEDLRDYIGRE